MPVRLIYRLIKHQLKSSCLSHTVFAAATDWVWHAKDYILCSHLIVLSMPIAGPTHASHHKRKCNWVAEVDPAIHDAGRSKGIKHKDRAKVNPMTMGPFECLFWHPKSLSRTSTGSKGCYIERLLYLSKPLCNSFGSVVIDLTWAWMKLPLNASNDTIPTNINSGSKGKRKRNQDNKHSSSKALNVC